MLKTLFILIAACAAMPGHAAQQCLIVGVSDGDTVTARCGAAGSYKQLKIRLSEIDAPEAKQDYGTRAKQSLSDLCFQQQANITGDRLDKYGRTLARVECRGRDAATHQVQSGMAWAYVQYLTDQGIKSAEGVARAGRVGLWADKSPVAPWEWRQAGKAATLARTAPTAPNASDVCHTGPKGGTYTITSGGHKNYAGC